MGAPKGWDEGKRITAPPGWDDAMPISKAQEPSPMSPVEGASPFPMGEVPTGKEMAPYARPIIEAGGQMAGGAAGSLLGPAGMVAGETAGYVGGSYLGDLLLGDSNRTLARRVGEGAAFSLVPFGVGKGAEILGKGAVRSALKIPPTQISPKAAGKVVDTVVKENLRVGAGGVAKAEKIIQSVEKDLNDVLSKSGSNIDTAKFVQAIDDIRPKFKYASDPVAANSVLDDVANLAMNHPEVRNGKIPIEAAQKLKKGLYQELKGFYRNKQSLTPKSAIAANTEEVGKAAWANSVRNEVMTDPTIPKEAVDWLKRESNVINALQWIKRRSNVGANMDPITFNDVLLGGLLREGVPYAVAVRFARSPAVLSQTGIYMAKGGETFGKALRTGATLAYPRTNLLK
jgi:hypothetical protein